VASEALYGVGKRRTIVRGGWSEGCADGMSAATRVSLPKALHRRMVKGASAYLGISPGKLAVKFAGQESARRY
jgi:hypothetical protein